MTESNDNSDNPIMEIRSARERALFLRDQLMTEYLRIEEQFLDQPQSDPDQAHRHELGRQAMRKAIAAAERAIASIDQALSEVERADEP